MSRNGAFWLLIILANVAAGVIVWCITSKIAAARGQNQTNADVAAILSGS